MPSDMSADNPRISEERRRIANIIWEASDFGFPAEDPGPWNEGGADVLHRTASLLAADDAGRIEVYFDLTFAPDALRPVIATARLSGTDGDLFSLRCDEMVGMLPAEVRWHYGEALMPPTAPFPPFPLKAIPKQVFLQVLNEIRATEERLSFACWPTIVPKVSSLENAVDMCLRLAGVNTIHPGDYLTAVVGLPPSLAIFYRFLRDNLPASAQRGWTERFAAAVPGYGDLRSALHSIEERSLREIVLPALVDVSHYARQAVQAALDHCGGRLTSEEAAGLCAEAIGRITQSRSDGRVAANLASAAWHLVTDPRHELAAAEQIIDMLRCIDSRQEGTPPPVAPPGAFFEELADIVCDEISRCEPRVSPFGIH